MGRRHHMRRTVRRTEVDTISSIVQENLEEIKAFFKKDRSFALSKFNLNPQSDDARLVALLPTVEGEEFLEVQLRRLHAARHLALRREAFHGSDSEFLRSVGLGSDALDGLRQGLQSRRIEIGTGIDGISFLMLPCFSRMLHLKQEKERVLIEKFTGPDFYKTLQLARTLTLLVHLYQRGFDDDIACYSDLSDK